MECATEKSGMMADFDLQNWNNWTVVPFSVMETPGGVASRDGEDSRAAF